MICKDIVALLDVGKKPVVVLTGDLWEDSWGVKGMVATISKHSPAVGDLVELTFDYNAAKEHNLSLQGHDWFIYKDGGKVGMGTAFEAGLKDINDVHETVLFEPDQDIPVALLKDESKTNGPLEEYFSFIGSCGDGQKPTYVQWLEKQFESLSGHHIHPTAEKRDGMSGEEAADEIAQRIYHAACLAERFEVPGKRGRFTGNGHHFAQWAHMIVKEEFLRHWHEAK